MSEYEYRWGFRGIRKRYEWAGVRLADAFTDDIPEFVRMAALRRFHAVAAGLVKRVREICAVPRHGADDSPGPVDISAFHTTFPALFSAGAALGMTVYQTYMSLARLNASTRMLRDRSRRQGTAEAFQTNIWSQMVAQVSSAVETRIRFAVLASQKDLDVTEHYRVFTASNHNLEFRDLPSILQATIVFPEFIPFQALDLHPLTRKIVDAVLEASAPFAQSLESPEADLSLLREQWTMRVAEALRPFLPEQPAPAQTPADRLAGGTPDRLGLPTPQGKSDRVEPFGKPAAPQINPSPSPAVAPGVQPLLPPPGFPPSSFARLLQRPAFAREKSVFREFMGAVQRACGQGIQKRDRDWRSDLLEQFLRDHPFQRGPIQADSPREDLFTVRVGGDEACEGSLYESPVDLVAGDESARSLREQARPILSVLRKLLYPSRDRTFMPMPFFRSGTRLSNRRLGRLGATDLLFERLRSIKLPETQSGAVLAIIIDGSGSVQPPQMKMMKVLASAWLLAARRAKVNVLAAIYNVKPLGDRLKAPVLRWIKHPTRSRAKTNREAVRALAWLPDKGEGDQSDALSIAHVLAEADRLARGRRIYTVILTDAAWCKSFARPDMTPVQEMQVLFKDLRARYRDRLHATLVRVGSTRESGIDDYLDSIIDIERKDLHDPVAVSQRIAQYVAAEMRRHRRKTSVV